MTLLEEKTSGNKLNTNLSNFLVENNLEDLIENFTNSGLNLEDIISITDSDFNELCKALNIKITRKLRLKTCLKNKNKELNLQKINSDLVKFLNNNNLNCIISNFSDCNVKLNQLIQTKDEELQKLCEELNIDAKHKQRLKNSLKKLEDSIPTLNSHVIYLPNNKDKDNRNSKFFNIALFGDINVGKTSIIRRYIKNSFDPHQTASLGASYMKQVMQVKELNNLKVVFKLWDTAGHERYVSLMKTYFKGAHFIIFVFDLTDRTSLDVLYNRLNDAKFYTENSSTYIGKIIVGNKYDLIEKENENYKRCIKKITAKNIFINGYKALDYIETSAKTSKNVKSLFEKTILNSIKINEFYQNEDTIIVNKKHFNKEEVASPKKNNCC